jgi:ATP-dependent RNA helicase DeaD
MSTSFDTLQLDPEIMRAVAELGFEEATPVQEQVLPLMLAGKDVIAQAQTGTGKTAAFGLPILQRLDAGANYPQALVLAPTRELAVQVAEAVHRMGKHKGASLLAVYGGQPIERQLRALRAGVQIVVGTPGRIMDHIRRGTLALDRVSTLILDEADEMLDMGFIEDIEFILEHVPAERQTGLFSATIPPRIATLAKKYMRDAVRVTIEKEKVTIPLVRQTYYDVSGRDKLDALTRLLDYESPASTIVFCARKVEADTVGESLQGRGYSADVLHGDLNQVQRDRVMNRFRNGQAEILVATDVAARGLDISDVSHVINYDIPWDPESYVHRIGRTGRAGRAGDAITLVTPREQRLLHMIERAIGKRLTRMKLPSPSDIASRRREAVMDRIRAAIDEGELGQYLPIVEALGDEYDPVDIAAAAFKVLGDGTLMRAEETGRDEGDDAGVEPGMTRLFIHAGRRAGIRPMDIVGAIANEANLPGNRVGSIDLYDNFSFVEVPNPDAPRVMQALNNTTLRGRKVEVNVAKPKR